MLGPLCKPLLVMELPNKRLLLLLNVPLVQQNFPADCWPEGFPAALVDQSTEKEIS